MANTKGPFDIGDKVRVTANFYDYSDTAADPTSVSCTVEHPDGSTTNPTVVKDDIGVYHADINVDATGRWLYRFEGTGDIQAAGEGRFAVRGQKVG